MKTLITGATGFIGRHIVRTFADEGKQVRCLTRKNSIALPGVEFIRGNLLDKDSLRKAVHGISSVIHLGGEVYSCRVKDYYQTNVIGTKNLLEVCLKSNLQQFIFFSSIAAAGPNKDKTKFHSEDDPCRPITPYGKSKLEAENLVKTFSLNYNIPATVIRLPVVYGPGQSSDITRMFTMVKHRHFVFFGNGENVKSTCYIKNLLHAIKLLEQHPATPYDLFYIADEKPYTIREIVQTIAQKEGIPLMYRQLPFLAAHTLWFFYRVFVLIFGISLMSFYIPESMALNFGCNISRAKEKLFYNPIIPFEQGIEETVSWLSKTQFSHR